MLDENRQNEKENCFKYSCQNDFPHFFLLYPPPARLQSYSKNVLLPVELHSRLLPSAADQALCDENDGNHAPLTLDKLTHRRR